MRRLTSVSRKAVRWDACSRLALNDRQKFMLNKLEGNLTPPNGPNSQDTASRDIADLIGQGVLVKNPGGGHSTSHAFGGKRFEKIADLQAGRSFLAIYS